ncbi:type II secretion system minor pseudopilin GspJ [Oceanobacter mangrovi]|uniref:type II secretion system minor pseudopilin GspJ n=1 Tax=Oceanobacter mangrovi TaxID=2862510 RepID=UPI001C8DE699|nr:type II secretion system minor pseudopilin GspJ [Oceanobacter mangrovi]
MSLSSLPAYPNPVCQKSAHQNSTQRGFTLLEVLIAVAITASIGVGAVQLLSGIINARDITQLRSEQMHALQRMNGVASRDIEQFINRSIRDMYGDDVSSLRLEDGDYLFEFSRAGWRNRPGAEDPRSTLQRVAYNLEDMDSDACEFARQRLADQGVSEPQGQCLVRYSWAVLDRAYDSEPKSTVVLDQIDELEISILGETFDEDGNRTATDWYSSWPIVQNSGESVIPVAVRWNMELPVVGSITRLWPIAHDGENL